MPKLDIHQFICREDNYGVLIHDGETGATVSIDAPVAAAIERELDARGWTLSHILVTHHHGDHTEGNFALKERFGCKITGPAGEAAKIPGIDESVRGGDRLRFAGHEVVVYDTPGHTSGHIAYHLPQDAALFAGDTLFAMGCGRVIEGTMAEMWGSLDRLRGLPAQTSVYCGHEYTEANARFALSVEPGNAALNKRADRVRKQRAEGQMTLPTTIANELETNPFLRPESPEIRATLGLADASEAVVFAALRKRKDSFR